MIPTVQKTSLLSRMLHDTTALPFNNRWLLQQQQYCRRVVCLLWLLLAGSSLAFGYELIQAYQAAFASLVPVSCFGSLSLLVGFANVQFRRMATPYQQLSQDAATELYACAKSHHEMHSFFQSIGVRAVTNAEAEYLRFLYSNRPKTATPLRLTAEEQHLAEEIVFWSPEASHQTCEAVTEKF